MVVIRRHWSKMAELWPDEYTPETEPKSRRAVAQPEASERSMTIRPR